MRFSDYIIYADESGDANPNSIDHDFPIFVLVFCIMRCDHYATVAVPELQQLKFQYFGHDAVVLHEQEIRRQTPPFVFLSDKAIRKDFMSQIEGIIRRLPFDIIATIVDKAAYRGYSEENPYHLALRSCLTRTSDLLRERGQVGLETHLIIESRGKREDRDLRNAFRRIDAAEQHRAEPSRSELIVANKQINSLGLQLADLVARPIGLAYLRPHQPNRAWNVIREKVVGNLSQAGLPTGIEVIPGIANDPGP